MVNKDIPAEIEFLYTNNLSDILVDEELTAPNLDQDDRDAETSG